MIICGNCGVVTATYNPKWLEGNRMNCCSRCSRLLNIMEDGKESMRILTPRAKKVRKAYEEILHHFYGWSQVYHNAQRELFERTQKKKKIRAGVSGKIPKGQPMSEEKMLKMFKSISTRERKEMIEKLQGLLKEANND
jgi:hypothetical protein